MAGGNAVVVVSSCVGSLRGKRPQRCFAPQPPEHYHDSIRNAYGTSSTNGRRRWNTAAVRRGSAVKQVARTRCPAAHSLRPACRMTPGGRATGRFCGPRLFRSSYRHRAVLYRPSARRWPGLSTDGSKLLFFPIDISLSSCACSGGERNSPRLISRCWPEPSTERGHCTVFTCHHNPVRAGPVSRPEDGRWSSYNEYAGLSADESVSRRTV